MNSLNDPSFMIESTPVVAASGVNNNNKDAAVIKNKKLSRWALDKNFSPIVFQVPRTPPPFRPKVAPEASQRQVNLTYFTRLHIRVNTVKTKLLLKRHKEKIVSSRNIRLKDSVT